MLGFFISSKNVPGYSSEMLPKTNKSEKNKGSEN